MSNGRRPGQSRRSCPAAPRDARLAALALLALLSAATPALATRLRPLNLEDLTTRASRIIHGRCLEVRSERDARLGRDVLVVTLQVQRTLKGGATPTLTFRQLAPPAPGGAGVVGMPVFRKGEEVILFMAGEASTGLSAPLGLGQGKFAVSRDKQGRGRASNGFGNAPLFRGLSERAAARLGPSVRQWERQRDIPSDTLLSMVESLQRKQP